MKTFLVKELRQNEQGEQIEVVTTMEFRSLAALIKYLQAYPKLLWDGTCGIQEEGKKQIYKYKRGER